MENLKLNQPKIPETDTFGGLDIRTISGLDAQQVADAKLAIFAAYIQVQANIQQPKKNKEGMHKAKYADLPSVFAAIHEATEGIDLAFIQQPVMKGGKSGVINYLINSKGAIINFGAYLLDVGGSRPQDAGGALTYARRYSISAIYGIASEEDTDAEEYNNRVEYLAPDEIQPIKVVYDGKRTRLITVYAKALAGDELAKQVIKDKSNSVKTKIAIKSLNDVYNINQQILNSKSKEMAQIEKENQERKKKEEAVNDAVKNIVDQAPQDPFNGIK